MSSSVWYEQIDKGLIEFIQSVVVLPNSDGISVPVPVRVRKADEDLKKEDYPMVTIYNLLQANVMRLDITPLMFLEVTTLILQGYS